MDANRLYNINDKPTFNNNNINSFKNININNNNNNTNINNISDICNNKPKSKCLQSVKKYEHMAIPTKTTPSSSTLPSTVVSCVNNDISGNISQNSVLKSTTSTESSSASSVPSSSNGLDDPETIKSINNTFIIDDLNLFKVKNQCIDDDNVDENNDDDCHNGHNGHDDDNLIKSENNSLLNLNNCNNNKNNNINVNKIGNCSDDGAKCLLLLQEIPASFEATAILTNGNGNNNNNNNNNDNVIVYDEFINIIGDSKNVPLSSIDKISSISTINAASFNIPQSDEEDVKPLLIVNEKRKPKSIVKSPSNQNFNVDDKYFTTKPKQYQRLSFQCKNNNNNKSTGGTPDRPTLHVQFLQSGLLSSEASLTSNHNHQQQQQPTSTNHNYNNSLIYCKQPADNGQSHSLTSSFQSESSSSSSSSDDDDDSSLGQYAEAKPPDGGWGWVVVFASFMVNLIADGITFSFGVIYVEFLNYFDEGKAKTAWIGSLFMAMPLLSGPIASFLTDRYGCRKVTIAGSILSSIGFVISAFSDSIEMLYFTFGIIAGFGLSLCYVAAVVIVAYYFDKRRSFATGLSVCGSGIGTFIFAPLTQFLIAEYGWRGTTLILAGLFLNMCVCGMLMRDLEWTTYRAKLKAKERKRSKLGVSADSFSVSNSTNTGGTASNLQNGSNGDGGGGGFRNIEYSIKKKNNNNNNNEKLPYTVDSRLFSSLITLPTFLGNCEKVPVEALELLSQRSNNIQHNVLFHNFPTLTHSRSFSEPLTSSHHLNGVGQETNNVKCLTNPSDSTLREKSKNRKIRNEQAFLQWLKNNENTGNTHRSQPNFTTRQTTADYLKDIRMHRHSLTYRGAMLNINRYRLRASSCPDIYRNSMTTIAKEKSQFGQGIEDFKNLVRDMLDISHFADVRFLLFAISNFLLYAWYDVPYVYLADNAIEMGFNETDASILISTIGIVNMFGEIILGWLGDRKSLSPGLIYAVCMGFCGLVTALVPLLKSYLGLSIVSGFFGLFIAANYALTSIILVDLITLERFTNAYGLLLLVQGVANLIGPPLAGFITDYTGNYDLSFYLSGIFIAASGIIMIILPVHKKCKKFRTAVKRQNSSGHSSIESQPTLPQQSGKCKTNGSPKAILNDCFGEDLVIKRGLKINNV